MPAVKMLFLTVLLSGAVSASTITITSTSATASVIFPGCPDATLSQTVTGTVSASYSAECDSGFGAYGYGNAVASYSPTELQVNGQVQGGFHPPDATATVSVSGDVSVLSVLSWHVTGGEVKDAAGGGATFSGPYR